MAALIQRRTLLAMGAGTLAFGCAHQPSSTVAVDPYVSLRGLCDDAKPLAKADFRTAYERAQALVQKSGHAALVVEAGYTMFRLSGVRWWPSERPFLLVVRPDGPPRWIAPGFEATRARERAGEDAELLLWQEHEDPYALIAEAAAPGSIAVDGEMRHFIVRGLQGAGREVVSGDDIVFGVRMIKTAPELALLERANIATKSALAFARERTRVGMTESEMRKLVTEAQVAAGLSEVWALVLFGENAAFPHGTGQERKLAKGDVVLIDTGGRLHGYCSDITRTWACGTMPDDVQRAWDTVHAAQAAAFEHLRPGVSCAKADEAARKVITDAGYGDGYTSFWHRLGHGIGLQGHEQPYLVPGNERVLEAGMTMSNEPGIYLSGKFGVRIEDILAITEDGHRVFGPMA